MSSLQRAALDASRLPARAGRPDRGAARLAGALLRGGLRRPRVAAGVRRRRARRRPSRSSSTRSWPPPGAPEFVNVVGLDVLGPSLLRFGNDEQRRRYIPRDPLRARRSGARGSPSPRPAPTSPRCARARSSTTTTSSLSGQKTWVSWGQFARWCGVLARTDDDVAQAPRHLDADRRHALAGRRGAADDADHRPRRVLRAVPRRRRSSPRRTCSAQRGDGLEDRACTRSGTSAGRPRSRARSSCAPGWTARSRDAARPTLDGRR